MLSQNNFFSNVKQNVAITKRECTLPGAAPSTSCCCNMWKMRERSQPDDGATVERFLLQLLEGT